MKTSIKNLFKHVCFFLLVVVVAVASQNSLAEAKVKKGIDKSSAVMFEGDTLQLQKQGIKKKATWSSSDKKKATVTKNGLVKAVKPGTVTISLKVGKTTYKCKINIYTKDSMAYGLELYKQGEFIAAQKVLRELPKDANEKKAIEKMPKEQKEAYLTKLYTYNWETVTGYFLTDVNNDGVVELLIRHGNSETERILECFTFSKGKLKEIGTLRSVRSVYYKNHDGNGLIQVEVDERDETVYKVTLKNGKMSQTKINGFRVDDDITQLTPMPYRLNNHAIRNNEISNNDIDVSELK